MFQRPLHLLWRSAIVSVFLARDGLRHCLQWCDNAAKEVLSLLLSLVYWLASYTDRAWTEREWGAEATLQALFWTEMRLPPHDPAQFTTMRGDGPETASWTRERNSRAAPRSTRRTRDAFEVTPQRISLTAGGDAEYVDGYDGLFASETGMLPCLSEPASSSAGYSESETSWDARSMGSTLAACAVPRGLESLFMPARPARPSRAMSRSPDSAAPAPASARGPSACGSGSSLSRSRRAKQHRIAMWLRRHKRRSAAAGSVRTRMPLRSSCPAASISTARSTVSSSSGSSAPTLPTAASEPA